MQVSWNDLSVAPFHRILGLLLSSLLIGLTLGLAPLPLHAQATDTTVYLPALAVPPGEQPPSEEPPGEEPPDDAPSTPFPNELTPQERFATVQSVESEINTLLPSSDTPLDARDLQAELAQLSTALLDNPHVMTTVLMTKTLTLQLILEDTSSILITNNRPTDDNREAVTAELNAKLTAQQTAVENSPANNVAGQPRAVVTNFDGGSQVAAEVRSMLQDAGYNIVSTGAGIGAMRSSYKNLGALYIDTHGASFLQVTGVTQNEGGAQQPQFGDLVYALQTSTDMSAVSLMENYLPELRRGEVVVNFVEVDGGWRAKLAITEKFIAKHWTFDNGVAVIHACFGGAQPFKPGVDCQGSCFNAGDAGVYDPTPLRQAMLNNGADLVMSFDNYTNANVARPSILYFFDRMVGANDFQANSNPPLRPFASDEVRKAMSQAGLLQFTKPSYILFDIGFGGNNVNVTFDTGGTPAGLVPSVQTVDVVDDAAKSHGELTLNGNFGDTQGQVEVGGIQSTIKSWTKSKIVVETPFSGPGATGDLIVKAPGNVESNPVPLTEWRGTVTVEYDPNEGSLFADATLDMRFRADLHRYRTTIDGNPQERTVEAYLSGGSTGSVRATGVYIENNGKTTWSGGGSLNVQGKQAIDTYIQLGPTQAAATAPPAPAATDTVGTFGGIVTLNPEANTARLCFTMQGSYDMIITADGQSTTVPGLVVFPAAEDLNDSRRGMLGCFNLSLGENYVIPSGQRSVNIEGVEFRVKWTNFQPTNPPTAQTPG